MKELIYQHDQQGQKLVAIKKLIENLDKTRLPSYIQLDKFVDDIKSIMEVNNES